jgi:hypothetical protein
MENQTPYLPAMFARQIRGYRFTRGCARLKSPKRYDERRQLSEELP